MATPLSLSVRLIIIRVAPDLRWHTHRTQDDYLSLSVTPVLATLEGTVDGELSGHVGVQCNPETLLDATRVMGDRGQRSV